MSGFHVCFSCSRTRQQEPKRLWRQWSRFLVKFWELKQEQNRQQVAVAVAVAVALQAAATVAVVQEAVEVT